MPAKLDRCVKHVQEQGKDKDSAYAICSKSTGWVKAGKHTWRKKTELSESAVNKVGELVGKTVDAPLNVLDKVTEKPIEHAERNLKKLPGGKKVNQLVQKTKDAMLADPTKQSPNQNAKEWAALMGAGSLASHIPALAAGDISAGALGALTAGNALKGTLIGRQLSGGKDSFLKSVAIPMGTMAIATPVFNDVAEYLGQEPDLDFNPYARVPLVGALSAAGWALRNRGKKDKVWW